jgi:hypothetical protein
VSDAGPVLQNSGLRRFGTPSAYQPYQPGQYSAQTFQAPLLPARQSFNPVQPRQPAGGLLSDSYGGGGATVGDPSSSPVSSSSVPGGMPGGLSNAAAIGISAMTGIPAFAISGLLGMASNSADAPSSSVGVGAAPGTPGGIGVAIGGDGSEGGPGTSSSVGVGAAEGTPGGIGGIGGDGSEGTGDGGGGGGGGGK